MHLYDIEETVYKWRIYEMQSLIVSKYSRSSSLPLHSREISGRCFAAISGTQIGLEKILAHSCYVRLERDTL